jgi:phosphohistidine phosphatase SixA
MIRDATPLRGEGRTPALRSLELRRHARRDPDADRLSPEGRLQAEDVGRKLAGGYAIVYVAPAERAAETAAWFLRGLGEQLPDHGVVPGLGGKAPGSSDPAGMAETVRGLLAGVPEGARALAVGHTPLIERAAEGLTGERIDPLGECEGILITEEDGSLRVRELRLPG